MKSATPDSNPRINFAAARFLRWKIFCAFLFQRTPANRSVWYDELGILTAQELFIKDVLASGQIRK
jgi:hypothetical protein